MNRGDVFLASLDPTLGSEQTGLRPVVIVSRDAINRSSPVVIAVPVTSWTDGRRIYPSQVLITAPEGGLRCDSIALGEQLHFRQRPREALLQGPVPSALRVQKALGRGRHERIARGDDRNLQHRQTAFVAQPRQVGR